MQDESNVATETTATAGLEVRHLDEMGLIEAGVDVKGNLLKHLGQIPYFGVNRSFGHSGVSRVAESPHLNGTEIKCNRPVSLPGTISSTPTICGTIIAWPKGCQLRPA